MKKGKYWGLALVFGLLIGAAGWMLAAKVKELKDPLNQSYAFVYSDSGVLHWFELTNRRGKVTGKLHEQRLLEDAGNAPIMDEKIYPLTGETTEKGYKFKVNLDGEFVIYEAWVSGPHLSVQKQGEKDSNLYNPVNWEELESYVKALQDYHVEEREKKQRKEFFTELRNVYGYLHSDENSPFQLFITIDEALLEGELTGSLFMIDDKGKETKYELNGITDGHMLKLYTTIDGKTIKLAGNFREGSAQFDLTFWTTGRKLPFHAVEAEDVSLLPFKLELD